MLFAATCTIHTGYSRARQIGADGRWGSACKTVAGHLPRRGRRSSATLARPAGRSGRPVFRARRQTLVFRSRGERNTASALDERLREPALAVLPLMVLRRSLMSSCRSIWHGRSINLRPSAISTPRHGDEHPDDPAIQP